MSIPQVKLLGVYRGETPLETFLAKFENCSEYMNWSERDRFFHLRNALDGAAGTVLWTAAACHSVDDLIKLLRCRFGDVHQTERFRAELGSRQRKPGESLQKLHQDLCRLMTLACLDQHGQMYDDVDKEAFLRALVDRKMRRDILLQKPRNMDEALAVACQLEAYDKDSTEQVAYETDIETGNRRGRNRFVRSAKTPSSALQDSSHQLTERMDAMESKLDEILSKLSMQHMRSGPAMSSIAGPAVASPPATPYAGS
jgi:hypothetical protein